MECLSWAKMAPRMRMCTRMFRAPTGGQRLTPPLFCSTSIGIRNLRPSLQHFSPTWSKKAPRGPANSAHVHAHSRGHLEPAWGILGHLGAILGPSWGQLGPPWSHLEPSWTHPGRVLGHPEPSGAISGPSWALIGCLGASCCQTEPSWSSLGAILRRLGPSWGRLGATWVRLGAILRRLGANMGRSWGCLEPN